MDLLDMRYLLAYTGKHQEALMSTTAKTIAKQKHPHVVMHPSARLFGQLGEMFSKPGKPFSAQKVSAALNKSLLQLQNQVSLADLALLRNVVQELARQVDGLVPINDNSNVTSTFDSGEWERALREDVLVAKILDDARGRGPLNMSTPESIRHGDEAIAKAEDNAAVTIAARIASHELITSAELQHALGVKRQAISGAVKAMRLFAIVGPSGENYYPAYYADPTLERRALEQVSKVLGSLPAPSKNHFFTSKSTMLQDTPLDALRKGKKSEVLAAAAGFAER
jgi:hypothetical protein